ncbi:hypothetical protein [Candidatus Symbiopectobacterium sp. 'North America']|uniref:hypothetical protein n=1 Tax=Candidatus Symbiopectobacterium sp. 'North America' TaxID=2794574 RepID=UPI0018CAC558|nr:hypothetical protein [Candidatus Symbiopectobacterium sp. 'North America']
MNKTIALCAAFLAVFLLSACGSVVEKTQPTGDWQDVNSASVKTHAEVNDAGYQ